MLHTMLAAYNEYQSRNSGDDIRRKIVMKVQEGGTHGPARIGYKNVGEGSRRWVEIDQTLAPHIRWCFEMYATGDWSVKTLLEEATARGLLSKGGPNTPRKPLKVTIANEGRLQANTDAAVGLLRNCHRAYERMKGRERRLMNQAFFKRVWVTEEGVVGWEYNEPFGTLMGRHGAPGPQVVIEYHRSPQSAADDDLEAALNREITRRSPGRWARAYLCRGLKQNDLAERVGWLSNPPDSFDRLLGLDPTGQRRSSKASGGNP
jgi:hypothetical protein